MTNQSINSNQLSTATCPSTDSEGLFATYLDAGGYDWQFEPAVPEKRKRPDFLVLFQGKQLLFEVKERRWREPVDGAAHYSPEKGIRKQIEKARTKFKEFAEYSCSLVIVNLGDWATPMTPINVFAAMLGDSGFTFEIGEGDNHHVKNIFLPRGGKMKNYKRDTFQSTTINAIIVLEDARIPNSDYEEALAEMVRGQEAELGRKLSREERAALSCEPPLLGKRIFDHIPRVAVLEHPHPRIPLRDDIFRGPFDERFRFSGDEIKRVYSGIRVSELITDTGGHLRHDSDVADDWF